MIRKKLSVHQKDLMKKRSITNRISASVVSQVEEDVEVVLEDDCDSIQSDQVMSDGTFEDPFGTYEMDYEFQEINTANINEHPSVTKAHERLVVADEKLWSEGRRILNNALIRNMYPSQREICESCQISQTTIQCLTCSLSQCLDCSTSYHINRYCHVLVTLSDEHGLVKTSLAYKNLSNCDPTCLKTKDSLIHLVDINGNLLYSIVT